MPGGGGESQGSLEAKIAALAIGIMREIIFVEGNYK